ncbi:MarP family serine protease [Cutibacterium namnetense]|uniref:Serine protease n=1 Tax=Cutibacterium namnetense TaxID=1574624 RepID=A0ABX9IE18_9ACTN|nr:MarP family serine protease [Cutibacterium namnetense]REB71208.1 serine protease [Cutibacterium namnetense]
MAHTLDIILAVILILRALRGWARGAISGIVSLIGLIGGVWVGLWASGDIVSRITNNSSSWLTTGLLRLGVVLVIIEVIHGLCMGLARWIRRASETVGLGLLDRIGGALLSVAATVLVVTVGATALAPILPPQWAQAIDESAVINTANRAVPPQISHEAARLVGQVADAFPKVFTGQDPRLPSDDPDDSAADSPGVRQAARSIVKVRSLSHQCDRASEGTGWVSSRHRVVTNAHVVAGSDGVTVQVGGEGARLRARVVAYDPNLDLAVLAVPSLEAPALPMASSVDTGDSTVIAGFPLDGPYTVRAARVRGTLMARGENIYGDGDVVRKILSLRGTVQPGNSGGPLLTTDGKVAGTIFARSTSQPQTGYALTNRQTRQLIRSGTHDSTPASTGRCSIA